MLLPKTKSDSGSGYSQIYDSGPEGKTHNSAVVFESTPDPLPPCVLHDCFHEVMQVSLLKRSFNYLKLTSETAKAGKQWIKIALWYIQYRGFDIQTA